MPPSPRSKKNVKYESEDRGVRCDEQGRIKEGISDPKLHVYL